MRVVTLSDKDFLKVCELLGKMVTDDSTEWLAVVGIASGGVYVAQELGQLIGAPVYSVKLQRPSTSYKKGVVKKIFRLLPRCVNDRLRIVESAMLSVYGKLAGSSGKGDRKVEIPECCARFLSGKKCGKVLVADDAVDSGHTMECVLETLRGMAPNLDYVPAVITVTTVNPVVTPEYVVYRDRTLVRFPWSIDAR